MDSVLQGFTGTEGLDDLSGMGILGENTDLTALLNAEINLMQMGDTGDTNLFGDLAMQ